MVQSAPQTQRSFIPEATQACGKMRSKLEEREEDVNIPRIQQLGPVQKLNALRRQYKNRDDGIRAAYQTGAYSYQQIGKEFGVHFTLVGRILPWALK